MLVVSTATPYKFARDTLSCVFGEVADDESAVRALERLSEVEIPLPIRELYEKPLIHTDIIEKEQIWQSALAFVEKL